jgi:hypothetical protein
MMCDVPSMAVFSRESIGCCPGIVSRHFFKILLTIPVAPMITSMTKQLMFHYYYYYYYYYLTTLLAAMDGRTMVG